MSVQRHSACTRHLPASCRSLYSLMSEVEKMSQSHPSGTTRKVTWQSLRAPPPFPTADLCACKLLLELCFITIRQPLGYDSVSAASKLGCPLAID